jgi:nucleoside-diphosphate-sugar epimerase
MVNSFESYALTLILDPLRKMAPQSQAQALVFGASGITGWAIVKAALEYPTSTTFQRVIGLTNRPLSTKEACLPEDTRLELYSGIDLSRGVDQLVDDLRSQIEGISAVTHVYFTGMYSTSTGNMFRCGD